MSTTDTETASGKPITQTERKSLEKLIEADFNILRREVGTLASSTIADRQIVIREAHGERVRQAEAIGDDLRCRVRKAEAEGFEVRVGSYHLEDRLTVKSTHLDEALAQVQREVDIERDKALALLSVKQNTALRDLLRVTISESARTLLDELPSARAIMAEAMNPTAELNQ